MKQLQDNDIMYTVIMDAVVQAIVGHSDSNTIGRFPIENKISMYILNRLYFIFTLYFLTEIDLILGVYIFLKLDT